MASEIHFYKTVEVRGIAVITPSKLQLTSTFNGSTELAQMSFYLDLVDVNGNENVQCQTSSNDKIKNECSRLAQFLDDRNIAVKIE